MGVVRPVGLVGFIRAFAPVGVQIGPGRNLEWIVAVQVVTGGLGRRVNIRDGFRSEDSFRDVVSEGLESRGIADVPIRVEEDRTFQVQVLGV